MFAYCGNNPINFLDSEGNFAISAILIAGTISGLANVASTLITSAIANDLSDSYDAPNLRDYFCSFLGGFLGGIAGFWGGIAFGNFVSSGATTMFSMISENVFENGNHSFEDIAAYTLLDASLGAMVGEAVPYAKVSKITSGRGNSNAVYNACLTKLNNGTIKNISLDVKFNGFFSEIVLTSPTSAFLGVVESTISNIVSRHKNTNIMIM